MTREEWNNENHDILQHFLSETEGCQDDVTASIKCVMVQWIINTRRALNIMAKKNNGFITPENVINAQIQELRRCVIDLTQHEEFKNNHKEGLQ